MARDRRAWVRAWVDRHGGDGAGVGDFGHGELASVVHALGLPDQLGGHLGFPPTLAAAGAGDGEPGLSAFTDEGGLVLGHQGEHPEHDGVVRGGSAHRLGGTPEQSTARTPSPARSAARSRALTRDCPATGRPATRANQTPTTRTPARSGSQGPVCGPNHYGTPSTSPRPHRPSGTAARPRGPWVTKDIIADGSQITAFRHAELPAQRACGAQSGRSYVRSSGPWVHAGLPRMHLAGHATAETWVADADADPVLVVTAPPAASLASEGRRIDLRAQHRAARHHQPRVDKRVTTPVTPWQIRSANPRQLNRRAHQSGRPCLLSRAPASAIRGAVSY